MNNLNKQNCNIIRDLLPSYLDHICTPDTQKAVDEHLSACSSCRDLAALMRKTDFASVRMEAAEIDYMKKTKRHFIKKGSFGSILPAVFVLLGLFTSIRSYNSSATAIHLYYLLLPCLLAATKALCPSKTSQRHRRKSSWRLLTYLGILLTCWGIFIVSFSYSRSDTWLRQGYRLFHLKPEQLGPFLHWQLLAILFYLTLLYLAGIYHVLCGKPFSYLSMSICLTGGFITLGEDLSLKCLSDASSSLRFLTEMILVFLLEGAVVTILAAILEKWVQIRKKSCR